MNEEVINRELNKIIGEIYEWVLREIKTNICKDQMREYGEELLHFMIIELFNKSPEYKQQLINDKKVQYWLLTSSGLQLRSSSSPFYRLIRETRGYSDGGEEDGVLDLITYEPLDTELYDCFLQAMDNLDFYQRKLVEEKYLNELSFKDISIKYQIGLNHIKADLYKALEKMRIFCKHI